MARLIVPIFSMRSYIDNTYSILKDGNFQLHLHRMQKDDFIVIPDNRNQKEFDELINTGYINKENIIELRYNTNALETRESFWENNTGIIDSLIDYFGLEYLITDITGYKGTKPFINNFNITKDPENPREYIDKFIDTDIESIKNSMKTFVLNQSQKDYLVSLNATLHNKIIVNQKVINKYIFFLFNEIPTKEYIDPPCSIFFPFRLTDDCYQYFDVVKKYYNTRIYITDPNNVYESGNVYDFNNVIKIENINKKMYYNILNERPIIIYKENPEKVFHPGLAEFIFFGCNIICDYKVPKFDDVVIKENEDVWLN